MIGHNADEQRQKDIEDRQLMLVHNVNLLSKKDSQIAAASDAVRALRGERKQITARIMGLGYSMEDLTRAMLDAQADLSPAEIEDRERKRAELREALGAPVLQYDLFATATPTDDSPASRRVQAETAGYQAALLGRDPAVPDKWINEAADFMRGWHKGQDRSRAAAEAAERQAAEEAAAMSLAAQSSIPAGAVVDFDDPPAVANDDDGEALVAAEGIE